MKKLYVVFCVLVCFGSVLSAQQRSGDNEQGAVEIVDARQNVTTVGKQWAVFIAIDEYMAWRKLDYPVIDAQDIRNILVDHYYIDEVRELYNRDATAAAIRRLFSDLQRETGPNDSVFVFHAGHGTIENRTNTSAWIPYDANTDIYASVNWLPHGQILSMLDSLPARHVFLISDSCFSGDLLLATRGMPAIVANYPAAYDRISRQVMASGASGEEVADESEFASRLKDILLKTGRPYITPDFLFYHIKEAQSSRPLYTEPNFSALIGTQHRIGGSFLFFRKNPTELLPENTAAVTPPEEQVQRLSTVQGAPGERGYFIGSWTAAVEYNNSFDTYEITFSANGGCTVKIIGDRGRQEANGNWGFDSTNNGTYTYIRFNNVVFRNPAITYQRHFNYSSLIVYADGNNSFNFMGRAATDGSPVRFTFFRN